MAASDTELSQDVVFDILSSSRRRYVLYHLSQVDEPVELTELAEHVAAWENDVEVDDLSRQERKRVYVSLYQTHVPKMADAGILDYDRDSGMVELTSKAHSIDSFLRQRDEEVSWQRLYLALALVGTVVVAAAAFDVLVFAAVSEILAAAAVVVAFLVVALAHFVYTRSNDDVLPMEIRNTGDSDERE